MTLHRKEYLKYERYIIMNTKTLYLTTSSSVTSDINSALASWELWTSCLMSSSAVGDNREVLLCVDDVRVLVAAGRREVSVECPAPRD